MVFVSVEMLKVLEEKLDKGWFSFKDFEEALGGADRALRVLLDMYCEGLLDWREGDVFQVTDAARRLVEAWRTSGRPEADPWIDSRVYWMLHTSIRAGGRIPEKWVPLLKERGFIDEEGELSPESYSVIEALEGAPRRLVITKAIGAALLELPEGPAERDYYRSKWLDTLEAMDLLVRSIFRSGYMALTRPGRLLKRVMSEINLDAPYPVLLNEPLYRGLEAVARGEEPEPKIREALGRIGYLSGVGKLTRAGWLALRAWRLLNEPIETPPSAVSSAELKLMRKVVELWEKAKSNPELAPDRKLLEKYLSEEWDLKHYSIGLTLYQLEALGLLRQEYDEELKKTVVRLTTYGERVLRYSGGRESTAVGSRVLVEADSGRSLAEDWVPEARQENLVGPGGPTKYGLTLAQASRLAERSILVTNLEAMILKRLPESRTLPREAVVRSFPKQEEEVRIALDKLESKGLIATRPDGRIEITTVGSLVKEAVMGAPSGVATPVNPFVIRLLEAVKVKKTDDVAELVKLTGLDLDSLKDALVIARQCKYIGRGGSLTAAGEALLEALAQLRRVREAEEMPKAEE